MKFLCFLNLLNELLDKIYKILIEGQSLQAGMKARKILLDKISRKNRREFIEKFSRKKMSKNMK